MMMEPGTKIKIINTSGQFPEELMYAEGEVMKSLPDDRSLVRIPGQKDLWVYNFRLREIEGE